MGNTQYNYSKITENIQNDIMQTAVNNVQGVCTNVDEYSSIIIDNSVINGDIRFNQVCEITGQQILDNSLDGQVNNVLDALQKQKQTTSSFFFQAVVNTNVNRAEIFQEVKNNLVQTALNSCQQNITNISRGRTLSVRNSTINGSVEFLQQGDISTTCFVRNLAKAVAFNQLKADQEQVQDTTVGFGNILIIIVIAAVVVIIGVVLYFVFTNKSGAGASNVKVIDSRTGLPAGMPPPSGSMQQGLSPASSNVSMQQGPPLSSMSSSYR